MERYAIALVSDWYPPRIGGVERQLYGLAHALHARGHDVRVITTARGETEADGIPVHRLVLPMFVRGDVAVPGPRVIREVHGLLKRHFVDVVHAHGMFSTLAHGAVISADVLGIPCVMTHHSLVRRIVQPWARLIYAGCGYRADIVSAVSDAAATNTQTASGRTHVAVLPNGVELKAVGVTIGPADTADGEIRVMSVMRLVPNKSPMDLVESVPQVLARVPDPARVRFTIVGDGRERDKLERRAARLGVAGRIEFLGFRPADEVARLLRGAQIYVSPVRKEAFGIALLEARAAGLPIVTMAGGGIGEIVEHGRHGFIARTQREFVDAIVRLIRDPELRRSMAAAAGAGLEPFGWDAVVERHLDVYRQAIAFRRMRHDGSNR